MGPATMLVKLPSSLIFPIGEELQPVDVSRSSPALNGLQESSPDPAVAIIFAHDQIFDESGLAPFGGRNGGLNGTHADHRSSMSGHKDRPVFPVFEHFFKSAGLQSRVEIKIFLQREEFFQEAHHIRNIIFASRFDQN